MSQQLSYNEEFFPFDQQPIQKMFDLQMSNQQSPSLKQVVIRQSLNKQQGFQVVHINTSLITPPKRNYHEPKRFSIIVSDKQEKESLQQTNQKDMLKSRKHFKGLKNLSIRVRDIVLEQKVTSYKDVAERLIQDLSQEDQVVESDNSKDESNIKRRVYDALNVMIASKILRREGRRVYADIYRGHKGYTKRNDVGVFKEQLQNLRKIMNLKKKRLQELYTKILALKNLIDRNKQCPSQNLIHFPILLFKAEQQGLHFKRDQSIMMIQSFHKIEMQADLDILILMQLHNTNCKNSMPPELQNLVRNVITRQ